MTQLDDALGLLNALEARLHKLRNTWPCGIRSVDDQTDEQIKNVTRDLVDIRAKVQRLREGASGVYTVRKAGA